jgi:diguanylate cyclase (GGDEF)-like protein
LANSNHRSDSITVEQAARLFGSLEAPEIVRAFEEVCSSKLGPCKVKVFTFLPDDRTRMVPFGLEGDAKPQPAPHFEAGEHGPLAIVADRKRAAEADRPTRIQIVLGSDERPVGLLEVAFETSLDDSGRVTLQTLAQPLAVAVRNGQTFERTTRLTFTDDLTALYNSRFMALYLEREIKRCRRMRSPLSLLFMDLDGFKNINDTHGHLAGSKTLVEVGAVLERTVRDADILIRYGGDEFVILFPETPLSGGLVIAERIRLVIGGTQFLESQKIDARVSASIGIAAYPESADDVRGLISSADRAMYEAKSLGKNRVVAARPLSFLEP